MEQFMMLFGTVLTSIVYVIVLKLKSKYKLASLNSVLTSVILIIAVLLLLNMDYDMYQKSSKPIADALGPLVVLLAVPLYKYKDILKKHGKSIGLGILISSVTSTICVVILSKVLGLSGQLVVTLLPKSITTPMALSMSGMLGGISGVTVVAVILTGIIGASIVPFLISLTGVSHPIAIGVSLGSTAHGIGTSKAIEIGDEAGAISGLAMGLTGVFFILATSLYQVIF